MSGLCTKGITRPHVRLHIWWSPMTCVASYFRPWLANMKLSILKDDKMRKEMSVIISAGPNRLVVAGHAPSIWQSQAYILFFQIIPWRYPLAFLEASCSSARVFFLRHTGQWFPTFMHCFTVLYYGHNDVRDERVSIQSSDVISPASPPPPKQSELCSAKASCHSSLTKQKKDVGFKLL